MPPIRTLVNDKPTPAASAVQNHHTPQPGAPSAIDRAPPLGGALASLPGFLTQPLPVPKGMESLPESSGGPFVAIAHPRSGKWPSQQAAGLAAGDFYLSNGSGYTKLQPMRYFLLASDVFRTKMNQSGEIVQATRDLSDETLEEHVVALVLAFDGDKLVPARADFRRATAPAGIKMIRAIHEASQPGWPDQSNAHKVAACFGLPTGRVVGVAYGQMRTSRSSGNPYPAADVTVSPAKAEEMASLAEHLSDPAFVEQVKQVKAQFDDRVAVVARLCK